MPTYQCHFTAERGDHRVSRHFKIDADTQELAVDVIVEQIGSDYADYDNPNFRFGPTKGLDPDAEYKKECADHDAAMARAYPESIQADPESLYAPAKMPMEATFLHFIESNMSDKELGELIRTYLRAACSSGFDLYSRRDMTGVRNFFRDLIRTYDDEQANGF